MIPGQDRPTSTIIDHHRPSPPLHFAQHLPVANNWSMETLLTPREVDQLLRYPRGRAVKLAQTGKLPAVFLPDGEIRFNPHDIETLVQSRRPEVEHAEGGAYA